MDINQLIDTAKSVGKIRSDSALGPHLGLTNGAVYSWRKGKALPSERTIYRLCQMADESPTEWILRLRMELADPEVKPVFEALLGDLENAKSAA